MNEERNPLDLGSVGTGSDQVDHELEERLGAAFASLRLLSDKDNPLSLRQAIARARREAENYSRWEASGAPLNDVTVRLSDGEELSLAKRIVANLCGLRIVKHFLPGEVLHVYKKGDRHFSEVLMYSVEVARIEGDEFTYEKTYRNQQTLTLQCRRVPGGEFDIGVSYTPPVGERAFGASPGAFGLGAVLAPTLLALAGLWYHLRRKLKDDDGSARPGSVLANAFAALALLVASVGYYENYHARRAADVRHRGDVPRSQSPAPAATESAPAAVVQTSHTTPRDDHGAVAATIPPGRARSGGAAVAAEWIDRPESFAVVSQTNIEAVDAASSCSAYPVADHSVAANITTGVPAHKPRAQRVKGTKGGGKFHAPPVNLAAAPRISVYVYASAPGDSKLAKGMLDAFVAALEKTRRFDVWTESPGVSVPKNVYEVSLDFQAEAGCFGIIFARLYDASNNQIWDDAKDCHEYPKATMLMTTSEEIVAKILPLIADGKERSRKGE